MFEGWSLAPIQRALVMLLSHRCMHCFLFLSSGMLMLNCGYPVLSRQDWTG